MKEKEKRGKRLLPSSAPATETDTSKCSATVELFFRNRSQCGVLAAVAFGTDVLSVPCYAEHRTLRIVGFLRSR